MKEKISLQVNFKAMAENLSLELSSDLAELALLDIKTVSALTGLKSSTIYEKLRTGSFPEPLRLGTRCTRWRAGDIRNWLLQVHEGYSNDLKHQQQTRAKKASGAAQAKRVAQSFQAGLVSKQG